MGSIRSFDIAEIKQRTGISTFVETGTLYGDGVDYALSCGFDRVISIEIEPKLVVKAEQKYKDNNKVEIVHGDSSTVIPEITEFMEEPALFWLDAHFPGADAGICEYTAEQDYNRRLPLEAELKAIHKRGKPDVIICDDLWIYEDGDYESGSFNDHCARHGQNMTREQICGKNLDEICALFEPTHKIKKYYHQQGFIVFMPK